MYIEGVVLWYACCDRVSFRDFRLTCAISRLTDLSKSLVNLESSEQLHTPRVRDIHFWPLRCVQIALDKHTFRAIFSKLKRSY